MDNPIFAAFSGTNLVAEGTAQEILPGLKQRFDQDPHAHLQIFNTNTGWTVDFDLRGSLEWLLAEAEPYAQKPPEDEKTRGPGRPKLGVTGREVTLLPRHWTWLETQPNGASAVLRRLVEKAMKENPGRDRARQMRAALNHMLTALAGDLPNYEEATRALFADEVDRLEVLVASWPEDVRQYAVRQARAAYLAANSTRL